MEMRKAACRPSWFSVDFVFNHSFLTGSTGLSGSKSKILLILYILSTFFLFSAALRSLRETISLDRINTIGWIMK